MSEIIDHQFNWIVTETEKTHDGLPEMTCTRCGATGGTNQWIDFLTDHRGCKVESKDDIQLAFKTAKAGK